MFAKLVGETGSVIAFEPGPKSFDLLSRNIAENGYRNIEANHAAVGDRTGEIDLFVCRTGESDNRVAGTLTDADARDRTTVRCVTLDDGVGGRPVDLIKMDVQGAEFMALQGAQATLRNNQNLQMVVEYSPGGIAITGASPAEFLGFIELFGLKFFMLDDQGDAHAVSRSWLLDNIGGANRRQQANILVKR